MAILDRQTIGDVQLFRRAANYMAAAMIYLQSNTLLEQPLSHHDIKGRLLGHWGTCPGLSIVYAHSNLLIKRHNVDMLYVVGPGHGAPAILACLWLEGSLGRFYPKYAQNKEGCANLISKFSTPSGFPSHVSAEVPGSIHEGGELGYALSVAFGSVMDKPDMITMCVVGDGEAETGPTATAWHAYKYIDPAESGAVLPIVHVNGFKISEPTIYGRMSNEELHSLFVGYGYAVRFVEDLDNIDEDMAGAMEWAYQTIRAIQKDARSGKPQFKPKWPVLIMRTPKGWGTIHEYHGNQIEGTWRSHQVPLTEPKHDKEQLDLVQKWLGSYSPKELFTEEGGPVQQILNCIPDDPNMCLGQKPYVYGQYKALDVPDWMDFGVKVGQQVSCTSAAGDLLAKVVTQNPHTFRMFSPDELESNKFGAILKVTNRNFQWDPDCFAKGGRVIEMLSEHTLEGMLQGYTLTGRTGVFPSYESFLGIIHTMMVQYSKFRKMGSETNWRGSIPCLNYVETSTWARQEHNGFSHQNPSFIGAVLNLKAQEARVYLPPDANCFLSTMAHCLRAKNYVNLIVGSKQPTPVWLSPQEADRHCIAGASVWKFASTDDGVSPDVVLVGIGCEVTFEVIAAAALLRKYAPKLRVRVVNVTDLMIVEAYGRHPHALSDGDFDALFTKDRPLHINYHSYHIEIQGLLFGRPHLERMSIAGYMEEGSTTTPFDMMLRNETSRYHVAAQAIRSAAKHNPALQVELNAIVSSLQHQVVKHQEFCQLYGKDPDSTYDTPVFHQPDENVKLFDGFEDDMAKMLAKPKDA